MKWGRAFQGLRRLTGPDLHASSKALQETFSDIYSEEIWTDKLPGMPRSGRGALAARSTSVVDFIRTTIETEQLDRIVDVGCGDLTYIKTVPEIVSGQVSYIGYDIVPALIAEHRRLPWGRFDVADVSAPGFRVDGDLVILKDVLFHLPDDVVARALDNVRASRWRLLLTTSSPNESNRGRDLDRWHFAPLNLLAPPYSLRPVRRLERVDGGALLVFTPDGFE
jgi:hypothetical protein